MSTIEKELFKPSSQSLAYREFYKHNDVVVKIEIKADNHAPQSHATAEVLNGLKWETLYTIPHSEMKTNHDIVYLLQYQNNYKKAETEFKADLTRIKNMVEKLI